MLNIYKYHTHPETLPLYERAMECVPDCFWEKYKDNPEELKKREGAIAKSAKYSYLYALYVLRNRFEAGEKAIATDAWYSFMYAREVLKERFEAGEKAIATDAWYSFMYAREVLKGRFEAGEKAIATDAGYSYWYAREVLKSRFEAGEEKILNSIWKQEYLDFLKLNVVFHV